MILLARFLLGGLLIGTLGAAVLAVGTGGYGVGAATRAETTHPRALGDRWIAHFAGIRTTGVLHLLTGGVLAAWGSGIGSRRLADHGLTMLELSWGGDAAAAPRIAPTRSSDTSMSSDGGLSALLRHDRVYGHRRHRRRLG